MQHKMSSCLFLLLLLIAHSCSLNLRPIIGIVSERLYTSSSNNSTSVHSKAQSYIVASYVKFIESAGGRVVPIFNDISQEELEALFGSINGVLFPGGGSSLKSSAYLEVAQNIFALAKQANDRGDYFPLWGTCLGFQLLCVLQTGTNDVLTDFNAENYSIPLNFTEAVNDSRLFSMYTDDEMSWLANEPITMNMHHYGITPEMFKSTPVLDEFYKILSTNFDRDGKEFVSSMEGIKYPFYGVQWHPEKNVFEWTHNEAIHHSFHAISITQTAANFLVQEARKSEYHFQSQSDEDKALIYNYAPFFSGKTGSNFEQEYIF